MEITSNSKRVYGLDVIRALAILIVVFGHGGGISGNLFENFPTVPLIDGVELFFVLSGFLIGTILIKQLNSEDAFSLKTLLVFWKRRWFRTLPNYYLVLLLNIIFVYYGIIGGNIKSFNWEFLVFLQNFKVGFVDFFWESWSLAVEEWFYILFPIIAWIIIRIVGIKNGLIITIISLLILPLLYRYSISDQNVDRFWWDVNFRKVILTRLDAIMYGVLAAYIKFYSIQFWTKFRNVFFVLGIVIIYIVLLFPQDPNTIYSKTIFFSIVPLSVMMLLPKMDSIQSYKVGWIGRPITYVSKISYAMYLVNLSLVAQVITHNFELTSKKENFIAYCIFWTVTFVLSSLIYHFYEMPLTKLRDRKWS